MYAETTRVSQGCEIAENFADLNARTMFDLDGGGNTAKQTAPSRNLVSCNARALHDTKFLIIQVKTFCPTAPVSNGCSHKFKGNPNDQPCFRVSHAIPVRVRQAGGDFG